MVWKKKVQIKHIRRAVQAIVFILLVFGGFFITVRHVDSAFMPFVKPPKIADVKMEHLVPQTQYDQVFDTYFPSRTCRYMGSDTRVYRACSMHFLTEIPIYGVPFLDYLPHLIFFTVLAFLLSRMLCGWLCPLGAMQDFLNWVRCKIGLGNLRLPRLFLNLFEKFHYAWLAFLFIMAVAIVIPAIGLIPLQKDLNVLTCNTCPGRIVFPLLTGGDTGWWYFGSPIHIAISLLGVSFLLAFALSFFGKRLWCKLCPTGALLSLFNKGGAIIKEKDARKCTRCGICERVCPMDQKKVFEEKNKKIVNSYSCIQCFRCVDECPEDDALKVKFFKWTLFRSKYDRKDKRNA